MNRINLLAVMACALGVMSTANAQLSIVNNLPGGFIDISSTGTPLDLGDDDEVKIQTTIGNSVFPAGRVIVGNNGGLGFDPVDTELAALNEEIPSNAGFGGAQSAFVFWDDIGNDIGFGDSRSGNVFWEEQGDTLIVQWHNRGFDDGQGSDTSRFQIQIFKNPSGLQLTFSQFIYDDIQQPRAGGGASATIGYQSGGVGPADLPSNDVQWSFNTPNAVHNGTVLSLVSNPTPVPTSSDWSAVIGVLVLLGTGGYALARRGAGQRTV